MKRMTAKKGCYGVLVLFLVAFWGTSGALTDIASTSPSPIYCNVNGTCTNISNPTRQYTDVAFSSQDWSSWCPDNYRQVAGTNVCNPRSCAVIQDPGFIEDARRWMEAWPQNKTVTIRSEGSDIVMCRPLSSSFVNDPRKSYLQPGEFKILQDGSLRRIPAIAGSWELPLGEYFQWRNKAVVRAENAAPTAVEAQTPGRCISFVVRSTEFRVEPSNGSLYLDAIHEWIQPGYFQLDGNGTEVHFCYQSRMPSCIPHAIAKVHLELLPTLEIKTIQGTKPVLYAIGEYYFASNGSEAVFCALVLPPLRSRSTEYLYASIALLSCLCLLVVLVTHVLFPRLNYHAKSLLCHSFSLFVMYLTMTVRYFCAITDDQAANVVLFAFQYVFGLSAFFWLSVLGYDFWRIFSSLRGTITPGGSSEKAKWFVLKCFYSWGTPLVLCITIIALSFQPGYEEVTGITFQYNWFYDVGEFYFFYAPIAVILLVNLMFFIVTVINIRRASSGADILRSSEKVSRKLFRIYMKIFVVMGLTWFMEIISSVLRDRTSEYVWYVTDIINCLQGVLIFLVYVCKKNTLTLIKTKFGLQEPPSRESTQSTSSKKTENIAISAIHQSQAHAGQRF